MRGERSPKQRAFDRAAAIVGAAGGRALLAANLRRRHGSRYIRVLAYHSVGESSRDSFRRQLDWLAGHFEAARAEDLSPFLSGEWKGDRPGLLISFDDGLLDNYAVAAPALEEAGFRGLFFVPSGLPGLALPEAEAFCEAGALTLPPGRRSGERIAMSWAELADLAARGHEIGCHTASHLRLKAGLGEARLEAEIGGAKREIEASLGRGCGSFAFVGGEADTYDSAAFEEVRRAGFRYAFTTLSAPLLPGDNPLLINRTVLEPDMDFELFKFKVSGLSDLVHVAARREVSARLLSEA